MKPIHSGGRVFTRKTVIPTKVLKNPNFVKRRLTKSPGRLGRKKRVLRHYLSSNLHRTNEDTDSYSSEPGEISPSRQNAVVNQSPSDSEDCSSSSSLNEHQPAVMKAGPQPTSSEARFQNQTQINDSESEEYCEEIEESRNFWFFENHLSDTGILVLRHPCQVVLSGCFQLRVVSGYAYIHGWNLAFDSSVPQKSIPIFSSSNYGNFVLSTTGTERLPKHVNLPKHLSARLASSQAEIFMSSVMSVASLGIVVLALSKLEPRQPIQRSISMLTPSMFSPQAGAYFSKQLSFSIGHDMEGALEVTEEHKVIAQQICQAIEYSSSVCAPAPRIVICGDQNTGKSTFMRFLINSVLSLDACSHIMHLDGDPGQSEFTPSCCVTLTSVNSPLLGPPFTHMKTPVRQSFVGGPSVENTPDLYSNSMKELLEYYDANFSSIPLFINTMGWSRGLGVCLLVDVLRLSEPNLVIQMDATNSLLPVLNTQFILDEPGWTTTRAKAQNLQLDVEFKSVLSVKKNQVKDSENSQLGLAPPLQRSLSTLTYLTRVFKNNLGGISHINNVQPISVPFNGITLLLADKFNLKREHSLQVLNGSWVALCSVPDSNNNDGKSLPETEKLIPNVCIGFGLVRGIDLQEKVFLVITPEPLSRLQAVNAMAVMGDILPAQVYENQNVEGPVPFTSQTSVVSKYGLGVKVKQTRKTFIK